MDTRSNQTVYMDTSVQRIVITLALFGLLSVSQAATVAPQPNLDLWDSGGVFAIIEDSDSNLYVGGSFSLLMGEPRANIARIGPDGTIDPEFFPKIDGIVYFLKEQVDGSILVGGDFTSVDSTPRHHLARLSPDGTLDASWTPSANDAVLTMAFGDNNDLFIGGLFTEINGSTRERLARISLGDGALDESWSANANGNVWSLLPNDSGGLWIGGEFTMIGGSTAERLAILDTSSGEVESIPTNGNVHAVKSGVDGNVYICGFFTEVLGEERLSLARLDEDLNLDLTWNPMLNGILYDCEPTATGLLVAGAFAGVNEQASGGLARFNLEDGQPDEIFVPSLSGANTGIDGGESLNVIVYTLSNGSIAVGGFYRYVNQQPASAGAIVNSNSGALIGTLDAESSATVRRTLPLDDGSWLIAGSFRRAGTLLRDNLMRLTSDGEIDPNWTIGTNGLILSLIKEGESVYLGGQFSRLGEYQRTSLGRIDLESKGAIINEDWAPLITGARAVTTLQNDIGRPGFIYAGGSFEHAGPGNYFSRNLIRISTDGEGLADTRLANPGPNGQINAIAQSEGGLIFLGGSFTRIATRNRRSLAAFANNDGLSFQSSFDAGLNGTVWALLKEDITNSLYVAGQFTRAHSNDRNGVFRLVNGQLDSWAPSLTGGAVVAMVLSPSDELYLFGNFEVVNGTNRELIARVNTEGAGELDSEFDPAINGSILWTGSRSAGGLWIGGDILQVDGLTRRGIAKLELEPETTDGIFFDRFQAQTSASTLGTGMRVRPGCPNLGKRSLFESSIFRLDLPEC